MFTTMCKVPHSRTIQSRSSKSHTAGPQVHGNTTPHLQIVIYPTVRNNFKLIGLQAKFMAWGSLVELG